MDKDFHTLIVRVDETQAKKLKLIAAFEGESMAALVREALDDIVKGRERKKVYRELMAPVS